MPNYTVRGFYNSVLLTGNQVNLLSEPKLFDCLLHVQLRHCGRSVLKSRVEVSSDLQKSEKTESF
jgi:hypothetical protein